MAIRDYLPPLAANHGLPVLPAAGKWDVATLDYLDRLADAIDSHGVAANVASVVSIPDVWAHPLVFAAAWSDPRHVLHSLAQGEWRGLLSILALAKYLDLGIELVPVNMTELSSNPWGTQALRNGQGSQPPNLFRILTEFAPRLTLDDGESWTNIAIIACDQRPLGLVLPSMLVCPARDYAEALPKGVYWSSDGIQGHLIDPTATDRISWGECRAIVEFLKHVWKDLQPRLNAVAPDQRDRIRLAGHLRHSFKTYMTQAEEAADRLSRGVWTGQFRVCDINPDGATGGPYPFLASTVDVNLAYSGDLAPSEIIMPARDRLKERGFKGAILFDRNIAEARGLAPKDVQAWGPFTLEQALDAMDVKERIGKAAKQQGYAVLEAEDLFTEQIFEVINGEVKYHRDAARSFLLPLKPLTLLMFRPEDLRSRIKVTRGADMIAVELTITMLSGNGQTHNHTVRRVYEKEDRREVTRPVMACWPDFSSNLWSHYLVFYSGQTGRVGPANVIPRHIFSMSCFLDSLRGDDHVQDLPNQLVNASAFEALKAVDAIRLSATAGEATGAFWSQHPAEALICETLPSEGKGKQLAGLMLLEPAKDPSQHLDPGPWKIGVDFGTTNTSIYMAGPSDRGAHPSELCFSPRLRFPFAPFEDTDEVTLRRHFLPPREESHIPFLSVLQERGGSQGGPRRPLFGRRVRYIRYVNEALRDLREDNGGGRIHFGLKWSDEAEDRRRVEDYLSQLAMQSVAELLSRHVDPRNIEWYFSYPGSFSAEKVDSFCRIYAAAINATIGQPSPSSEGALEPKTRLESEAAARYFRNVDNVSFGQNVITVDVGGGTSDICIWCDRRLIWQTSQHLAGQHILIDYLASHLDFVDLLHQANAELASTKSELEGLKGERSTLWQGLEIFINNDLFREAYTSNMRYIREDEILIGLRNIGLLSLAGLIYFLGLVAKHLKIQGLLPAKMTDLRFCLGGRGSLIFREISEKQSNLLVDSFFSTVSGITVEHASFHYSRQPKHEVAFGLMVPPVGADDLESSNPYEAAILGEEVSFGEQAKASTDSLGVDDLDKRCRIDSLPEFERFATKFQELYGISVPLQNVRHDLIARVANDVDSLLDTIKKVVKKNPRSIYNNDAIFVTILRNFLSLLNEGGVIIK